MDGESGGSHRACGQRTPRWRRRPQLWATLVDGSDRGLTLRVRLLFCLLTLISVALRIMLLPLTAGPPWPAQVLAVLSLTAIGAWSVWVYRHGRVPVAAEAVVPLGLVTWGVGADNLASVYTMLFAVLFQRALYGTWRRVATAAGAYLASFLVVEVVVLGAAALRSPITVTNTVGVLFCAWLMHTLGRVLRLHEERARCEAVVVRAGGQLLAASSTGQVYEVVLDTLEALTGPLPACVGLWRIRNERFEEVAVRGADAVRGGDALQRLTTVPTADLPADVLEDLAQGRERFFDRQAMEDLMLRLQPSSGAAVTGYGLEVLACPLRESGKVVGGIAVGADALPAALRRSTAQLAVQAGLVLERLTLHQVVRGSVDGSADTFVTVDGCGRVEFASASVRDLLGCAPEAVLRRAFADHVHPDDVASLQARMADPEALEGRREHVACRLRHADGGWRDAEISARPVTGTDGRPAVLLNVRDVTDRKALEAEVAYRAYHDGLTGLPNRVRFAERLEQALERARRSHALFAVAFLDLDDFKIVNDSLGHTAGDELLVVVARRLQERLRPHDVAARFGGDEFAVLIEDAGAAEDAHAVVARLLDGLRTPIALGGSQVTPHASVGLVTVDQPQATTSSEIMRDADIAMYAAKRAGKGRLERFRRSMRVAVQQKLRLRTALGQALARGEFSLQFQPVLDLASGRIHSAEALLRWHHPELGLLLPGEFVPLAEEDGTIVAIDRWVLSETCRQLRRWHDLSGATDFAVSVNVSARTFQDDQHEDPLTDVVAGALERHGVPASSLIVEITESTLVLDTHSAGRTLTVLRDHGVRVSIDDFGNGSSSLSYLQRFPVDYLKVDRSFVEGIDRSPGNGALAHAIVRLAGTLGATAVAEGIEDGRQAAQLRRWGCELGQGFLFAPPSAPDALDELLRPPPRSVPVAVGVGVVPGGPADLTRADRAAVAPAHALTADQVATSSRSR